MMFVSTTAIALILLSQMASRRSVVMASYETYEHQFQTSANIVSCPAEGGPFPFVLNEPYISARKKAIILSYEVTVPDPEWLTYEVFDAATCTIPIPTGSSGSEPLISTLEIDHDSLTGVATAKLTLEVNEGGLQEYGSMIYTETERTGVAPYIVSTGQVTFCVRLNMYNGLPSEITTSNGAIQLITWLDTETVFVAELEIEDESQLDFTTVEQRSSCQGENCRRLSVQALVVQEEMAGSLRPGASGEAPTRKNEQGPKTTTRQQRHLCETSWGMEIVTCPDTIYENTTTPFTLVEAPNNNPFTNDEIIRFCIQPNESARKAGLAMKQVESLFYRALPVVQAGVESGYVSGDGMTFMACGKSMCVVESILYRDFFLASDSQVMVSGTALFQPSEATFYIQTSVEFSMYIAVEAIEDVENRSGAFSAKSLVAMALTATGILALFL